MKSIKITASNTAAIFAALSAVNGTAAEHTFCSAPGIIGIAAHAEKTVIAITGTKKTAPGAIYRTTSGERVASAYKYSRTATEILLTRRASDWYLVDVTRVTIYAEPPKSQLTLTAAQDAAAVAHLRSAYFVATPIEEITA